MKKCFLFDIGNVLANFQFVKPPPDAPADSVQMAEWPIACDYALQDAVECGRINDQEFIDQLNAARDSAWTVADLTEVWRKTFTRNPAGWALLQTVFSARVPVYFLSNIAQHHVDAIEQNWPDFFDEISGQFLSYKMGVRKPDPMIYQQVLDQLGVKGEYCFFIDDMANNVETAREFGIQAYQFTPENYVAISKASVEFLFR